MKRNDVFDLRGRTVLLTGATGRLGEKMAFGLAEAQAHVLVNSRSSLKCQQLASAITRKGGKASPLPFDITGEAKMTNALAKIKRQFKGLDVLINNAYAPSANTIEKSTAKDFRDSYERAVVAPFLLLQGALPLLKEAAKKNRGGASVINIASMYGSVSPDPSIYEGSQMNNPPYYGAAKAALIQFTKYAACHLAPFKIRVNAISPGPFPGPEVRRKQASFFRALCRKVPLGRVGNPEELQGAVVFLASDAASFITGVNLPVDGGWTAW